MGSPKIQVCITTYERTASLRLLLLDLEREGARRVRVYDDCSQIADYTKVVAQIEHNGWKWQRAQKNHGRVGHPRFLERIWQDLAKEPAADLYVFLQDDNRLCARFFDRLEETWQSIGSSKKATLMLMTDSRDTIWGSVQRPEPLGKADRIGWVDAIYAAPLRTLHDLDFKFPVVPPRREGSSGAGMGLTGSLRRLGRTMYRANPSLIVHLEIPSQMHATERKKHPLLVKNFVDGEARHAQLLRGEF